MWLRKTKCYRPIEPIQKSLSLVNVPIGALSKHRVFWVRGVLVNTREISFEQQIVIEISDPLVIWAAIQKVYTKVPEKKCHFIPVNVPQTPRTRPFKERYNNNQPLTFLQTYLYRVE
jgi:hypothetical protein